MVRRNDRIPKRLEDNTEKSGRKELMIFNNPDFIHGWLFFSVVRRVTPILHIPDNVHSADQDAPSFFLGYLHPCPGSRVDSRSFSQYHIQIALYIEKVFIVQKSLIYFALSVARFFSILRGVTYV